MRTVSTDAERNALVPQNDKELISQNGALYLATGLIAGAWQVQSNLPVGMTQTTSVTVASTDAQIPTAKAVWDAIQLAIA